MEEFKSFVSKFTPYLEDIRRRLYYTAFFFALAFVGGFFGTRYILHAILSIFELNNVSIVTTSPFQFADLSIDIGIFFAFLISFPVLIYNIYSFFGPAFNKREKRVMLFLVPCSLILFIFGFFYGFAIMYYALMILAEINIQVGIKNIWDVGMFLSQIILTSALLGALFQFPLMMTLLVRFGLLNIALLKEKRRISYFIIVVFVTLLPPTDGLSLLAMALPLVFLYEVTIFVNSWGKHEQLTIK